MNKQTLVFIIIVFALFFSLAGLISMTIEKENGTGPSANSAELVILTTILGLLLFGIIVLYLFPKIILSNNRITKVVRLGALAGLFWFFTQSGVLFDKLTSIAQSEIVGFAIYNVVEVAISRIIIVLLYGMPEYSSLPAKRTKT